MTGYLELKYRRGRRLLRPPSDSLTRTISPRTCFRSRWCGRRGQQYTLYRAPTQLSGPFDPRTKRSCGELVISTIGKSRNRAKRLLHSCSSSTTRSPVIWYPRSSNTVEVPVGLQHAEDMAAVDTRRGSARPARPSSIVGGPISGMVHRPSLAENVRTASIDSLPNNKTNTNPMNGNGLDEKPLASGNGVSLSIALAEPVLFLQGLDQSEVGNQSTTMLRGSFHLRVSKSAKIKTISLAFRGRAETEWPEGQSWIMDSS